MNTNTADIKTAEWIAVSVDSLENAVEAVTGCDSPITEDRRKAAALLPLGVDSLPPNMRLGLTEAFEAARSEMTDMPSPSGLRCRACCLPNRDGLLEYPISASGMRKLFGPMATDWRLDGEANLRSPSGEF